MNKLYFVGFIGLLFIISGCGEPTEKEMKQNVIKVLQKDNKISKAFVEMLDIKYGNGILALYDNCPELVKLNDEKLSNEYKKKEQVRKGDVWSNILAVGFGNTIYNASLKFRDECQKMRYRAANLSEMIDGVKEVRVLK